MSDCLRPMDYSPPRCSFHGIFQASILGLVAISFSSGSSWPREQTHVSCIGRGILHRQATREAFYIKISNYKGKLEPRQRTTAEVAGVTYKWRPEGSGVSHAVRTEQEASTSSQRHGLCNGHENRRSWACLRNGTTAGVADAGEGKLVGNETGGTEGQIVKSSIDQDEELGFESE